MWIGPSRYEFSDEHTASNQNVWPCHMISPYDGSFRGLSGKPQVA